MAVGIVTILDPLAQIQKAQDAKRKSDLSQIQKALETFYQDVGKYPKSDSNYRIIDLGGNSVAWGSITTGFQPYMATLPKDPSSSKTYVYFSSTDGQTYYLYANLDRQKDDPQACFPTGYCSSMRANGVKKNACVGWCNYGVSSPNVSP